MYVYPVTLTKDDVTQTWMVACRDFPLMHSVGDTQAEALEEAITGLTTAIAIEIDERRPVPAGSAPQAGEFLVALPVLVTMKAALHNAMIETGTRKADLARKLGQKQPQIDRLLDVEHSSRIETVELALRHLNRTASVTITVG